MSSFSFQPRGATGFRQITNAQNVALPLRDRNHAAGIEQVEDVARFDALIVGGEREQVLSVRGTLLEQRLALGLCILEVAK